MGGGVWCPEHVPGSCFWMQSFCPPGSRWIGSVHVDGYELVPGTVVRAFGRGPS